MIHRWMSDDVLERVQRLRPVAAELGLTMAQLAVAWVLQNPAVASAIIGASRPEQVVENAAACDVTLPAEALQRIDSLLGDAIVTDPARIARATPRRRPI
jgi:aryl-alcohol dehydrogenase-like predicted oxidoreductase